MLTEDAESLKVGSGSPIGSLSPRIDQDLEFKILVDSGAGLLICCFDPTSMVVDIFCGPYYNLQPCRLFLLPSRPRADSGASCSCSPFPWHSMCDDLLLPRRLLLPPLTLSAGPSCFSVGARCRVELLLAPYSKASC
ncbi:hypothetical protein CRG98_040785 [Punica granatum]|uniref:Uncharacterized protein n=1 Tax=Punica granatum TaxID=22663 RepID=A0A2I0I4C4_PUNGR|nr:hypothetical protein CRG98_040785 [Punica granatum]